MKRFFSAAKRTGLLDTHRYIKLAKILLHVGLSTLTWLATMLMHAQDGRIEDIRKVAMRCE